MNPDVFLEVAEEIETGDKEYVCIALKDRQAYEELFFYERLFKPAHTQRLTWMLHAWADDERDPDCLFGNWSAYEREVKGVRVMMLCLAYHLACEGFDAQ